MAILFKNIKNNEITVADSEPKISALWSSGNRGPNAQQGQDFGWRLAEEVELELRRIKRNSVLLQNIANNMNKAVDEIKENDILKYISDRTKIEDAPIPMLEDYDAAYNAKIIQLERKRMPKENTINSISVDSRLEEARIEADELGIDISVYGDHLGLIKGAITRFKNRK